MRTEAFVTRILLEGTRAVGVAYTRGGEHHVRTGGGRGRAQRRGHQQPAAADAVRHRTRGATCATWASTSAVESPGVGQKLQDHPAAGILSYTRDTTDIAEMLGLGNLLRWKATGKGPLSSNVGEAGAFFTSRDDLDAA